MTAASGLPFPDSVESVRAFWNTEACGTHFVREFADDRDFFRKYRKFRYQTEWHIPAFAAFPRARDRSVLEIGCGNGADGAMFAMHGARYTGVDLTAEAIDKTRRHFAAEGLSGSFHQENCERLGFADESFDIVYSFGVLHHTPSPERAVDEVYRVLKPGGTARVMLYHRHSFNYYVRILGYMRARVLLEVLGRTGRRESDRRAAEASALTGLRGNESAEVWKVHYQNFLRQGWNYFAARNFVPRCTDGPECPYAFTYSSRDARRLFARFSTVQTSVGHLPLNKYPGLRHLPRAVERLVAGAAGWHLLIQATK